jgi:hypothetical protein
MPNALPSYVAIGLCFRLAAESEYVVFLRLILVCLSCEQGCDATDGDAAVCALRAIRRDL